MMKSNHSINAFRDPTNPNKLLTESKLRKHPHFGKIYNMLNEGKSFEEIYLSLWRQGNNNSWIYKTTMRIVFYYFPVMYRERYVPQLSFGKYESYYTENELIEYDPTNYSIHSLSGPELEILKKLNDARTDNNSSSISSDRCWEVDTIKSYSQRTIQNS